MINFNVTRMEKVLKYYKHQPLCPTTVPPHIVKHNKPISSVISIYLPYFSSFVMSVLTKKKILFLFTSYLLVISSFYASSCIHSQLYDRLFPDCSLFFTFFHFISFSVCGSLLVPFTKFLPPLSAMFPLPLCCIHLSLSF